METILQIPQPCSSISGLILAHPIAHFDPCSRYQYDVDAKTQAFKNRRVFAYVDNGVADGIQIDSKGNVYSGCGDGVQVNTYLSY